MKQNAAQIISLPSANQTMNEQLRRQELIAAAKDAVLAQEESRRTWERLRLALENYTGEHWTKWGR